MKDIIKTILYEWRERKLPDVIKRKANLMGYVEIKPQKIVVITGFRRVGKTYLCFQLINELLKAKSREEVVYINFEDERIPEKTEFLSLLLPTIRETFEKFPEFLFLDEIQNIPGWGKWLRRIYDSERMKIFVTGSSSKASSREIPTELRGRCLEVELLPLSFKEFIKFKDIAIDFHAVKYSENEKAKLMKSLNEYLYYGAMPEIVLFPEEKKNETLQQYYRTVIGRDIIERFRIKNEEGLRAMLRLLLNSTSYSISKLHNILKSLDFKIGKTTLQNYFSYIESSYFVESVPIFSYKVKNQMQYPRKVYFIDNGFINVLSTKLSRNFGRLYENLVFRELKRKIKTDAEIFYWKNSNGKEVDFVIKGEIRVDKLIQVCYNIEDYDTMKRETRSLLRASKEFNVSDLLIITKDYEEEEEVKGIKIKFVPLWKWLLS